VVLTGAKTFTGNDIEQTEWRAMHPELAALSSRGAHRLVNCGHGLPFAAPDAVIEAIECVATAAATG